MRRFWSVLIRVEIRHRHRKVVRESVIGLLVGCLVAACLLESPQWTFLGLLGYFLLTQMVAMFDDGIFMDFRDWCRLGFRTPSLAYRCSYVLDYLLRDMWIATGLALALCLAASIVFDRAIWGISFVIAWLSNLWMLPSHAFMGFRLSVRVRTLYLCVLICLWGVPAFMLASGLRLPGIGVKWLPLLWPIGVVAYAAGVDQVLLAVRSRGFGTHGARDVLVCLKRVSIFVFKDILLCWTMVVRNLVMAIAMFIVWSRLAVDKRPVPLAALLFMAASNPILGRVKLENGRGKGYRLIEDDRLFSESALPRDAARLRRSKLATLLVVLALEFFVYSLMTLLGGVRLGSHLLFALMALVVTLILDAPLLFTSGSLARNLRYCVKYSVLAMFLMVTFAPSQAILFYSYCCSIFVVYGPGCVGIYLRKRALKDLRVHELRVPAR